MRLTKSLVLLYFGFLPFQLKGDDYIKSPMIGNWSFHLPDTNPVWLSIKEDSTALLLWGVGSAKPVKVVFPSNTEVVLQAEFGWRPYGLPDWYRIDRPIIGKLNSSGIMELQVFYVNDSISGEIILDGKKMPPIPSKPILSGVKYGETINLLENGVESWMVVHEHKINGWKFREGELINETPKTDFGAYGSYCNLRTRKVFEDFELKVDYNVPEGGNSGIYLRGAYEVQIVDRDSKMQGIQGPGAIFGRLTPIINNANPGGEWNRLKIILVDRHVTVELNDKIIIDNQPIEGCTGGGINSDDTKPGPIFLQGDHTSVKFKNMFLREVIR